MLGSQATKHCTILNARVNRVRLGPHESQQFFRVPLASSYSSFHKALVMQRFRRTLSLMPSRVAEKAGGDDVRCHIFPAVFYGLQMLSCALKALGQTCRYAQLLGEFFCVAFAHRARAVEATTILAGECSLTEFD